MPTRIRFRRTKGYRLPEGAIYVGRPTKFGNPFPIPGYGLEQSLTLFWNSAHGIWDPAVVSLHIDLVPAYEAHQKFLKRLGGHPVEVARAELGGHDLACWCAPEARCHADIWLAIANAPP